MQPVDYTTLVFVTGELNATIVPSRLEQVVQSDRFTVHLGLKTFQGRKWLTCSWHPEAGRIHLSRSVAKYPDTFTFSQQIWHQAGGLALVRLHLPQPWDRVIALEFAPRPDAPTLWYLYLEIMGKYSNSILVNQSHRIVTAAHQVNSNQSRLRPIATGDQYQFPPHQRLACPDREEGFASWQSRLNILDQPIGKAMLSRYRGLSRIIVTEICQRSGVSPEVLTSSLTDQEWLNLYQQWQFWLECLIEGKYTWKETENNYYLIPEFNCTTDSVNLSQKLADYYDRLLNKDVFKQILNRISQVVATQKQKLLEKVKEFESRLAESDRAEAIKEQADLLMANLHLVPQGAASIKLPDFQTNKNLEIKLDPALTPSQNAQKLYKSYQKQKRAREAIEPLLLELNQEISYLTDIDTALSYLDANDIESLREIYQELVENGYSKNLKSEFYRPPKQKAEVNCYRYFTPQGNEIWIGKNNTQNDNLTFRIATEYDLWFHALEISGSHVLLRLKPGIEPDGEELELAANFAAFYSRARYSEQVAVIYTNPRWVFKPKGAKPGTVVYKQEKIIWARPHKITNFVSCK